MEIELREMKLEELGMIEQVDRSERVEAKYKDCEGEGRDGFVDWIECDGVGG